jgi:uncharacterized protein with von Willebrand factor type A (vWA) domain
MDKLLGDFVSALRHSDLAVSPAETLDAVATLDLIGMTDRRLFRNSLSIVLAKTAEEKRQFEICFDRFFSATQFAGLAAAGFVEPETLLSNATSQQPSSGQNTPLDESSIEQSSANNEDAHPGSRQKRNRSRAVYDSRLAHLLMHGHTDELLVMMRTASDQVNPDRIKSLRERGLYSRRILLHMGSSSLDEEIDRWQHQNPQIATRLTWGRQYLEEQVRDYVDQQYLLRVDGQGDGFIREAVSQTQLTNMQPYYFDHIREAVRKLAHQLAKRHARKHRLYNRGQLDIRRTLRRNLAYDGAMFDLRWKQVRLQRPRVFVICDVSGSVRNVARFLLTFLYSLNELLPKVRSFAFSNDLGEVSELFDEYGLEDAIEMSLADYGLGSTDYGNAFRKFIELALSDVDSRSTVIILGDSRNNYFATGNEYLKQVYARARQVVWLNPEQRSQWSEGDAAMQAYLPFCHHAEVCNSLADLERMVGRILRSAH